MAVLSLPTAAATSRTTADFSVNTDTAGGVMYRVATASATTPDAANVIDGLDAAGNPAAFAGSMVNSAAGVMRSVGYLLTALATFTVHFVQVIDDIPSNVVSSAPFVMDGEPIVERYTLPVAPVGRRNHYGGNNPGEDNAYGVPNSLWNGGAGALSIILGSLTAIADLGYPSAEINLPGGATVVGGIVAENLKHIADENPDYFNALRLAVAQSPIPVGMYGGKSPTDAELRLAASVGFSWYGIDSGWNDSESVQEADAAAAAPMAVYYEGADAWYLDLPRATRSTQLFPGIGGTLYGDMDGSPLAELLGNPCYALVVHKPSTGLTYYEQCLAVREMGWLVMAWEDQLTAEEVLTLFPEEDGGVDGGGGEERPESRPAGRRPASSRVPMRAESAASRAIREHLEAASVGPRRASGDEGSVEMHRLPDLIAADRYARSRGAPSRAMGGLRFTKLTPPGTA